MCLRRNAQHRELTPPPRVHAICAHHCCKVAVPTCGPTGCPVSPPPLSSQNIQSHEQSPTSHRARGETQTMSLAGPTMVTTRYSNQEGPKSRQNPCQVQPLENMGDLSASRRCIRVRNQFLLSVVLQYFII